MQAYPFQHKDPTTGLTNISVGMTLRDYFAAKALTNFYDQIGSQSDQEWFEKIAQGAYRMADAMMEARK
jgi:hypothetical protein